MIILEEHFKWHLEAFASELFIYMLCGKSGKLHISCFRVKQSQVIAMIHNKTLGKSVMLISSADLGLGYYLKFTQYLVKQHNHGKHDLESLVKKLIEKAWRGH